MWPRRKGVGGGVHPVQISTNECAIPISTCEKTFHKSLTILTGYPVPPVSFFPRYFRTSDLQLMEVFSLSSIRASMVATRSPSYSTAIHILLQITWEHARYLSTMLHALTLRAMRADVTREFAALLRDLIGLFPPSSIASRRSIRLNLMSGGVLLPGSLSCRCTLPVHLGKVNGISLIFTSRPTLQP